MSLARPAPALGTALVVLAVLCFAAMDTTVAWLAGALPLLVMLTLRYAIQALAMVPYLLFSRRHGFRSARPRFQALRGALLLLCSAITFLGLRHLPVGEFTAVASLTPVIVTLMAATLLREHVTPLRWALVVGAFGGVLLIVRPGGALFGWPVLLPLAGAIAYAGFQTLTTHYAAREDPYTTHFWTGAVGALVMLPLLAASPIDAGAALAAAGPAATLAMVGIGLAGTLGHLLLILAFSAAPASRLAPFLYVQIAFALLLGGWVSGHWPDTWAWLGMAVIGACGAASAALNLRTANARREASPMAADTVAE